MSTPRLLHGRILTLTNRRRSSKLQMSGFKNLSASTNERIPLSHGMCTIIIVGWRSALQKVKLNHVLRAHSEMSLSAAKAVVDRILDGDEVSLTFPNDNLAEAFARDALACGVIIPDHR